MPTLRERYATLQTLWQNLYALRPSRRPVDTDWRTHAPSLAVAEQRCEACQKNLAGAVTSALAEPAH